jgi:2-desacetyl-2-hydroxyethyl bacteriochlorophyllide A dehydrogenase
MKSLYVVFPSPGQVEVREEEIAPPGPGEILCASQKSLISIGTETSCLRGVFDPGTYWADWVHYPFRPGYSMAAAVVAVGEGVTQFKEGDRVTGWAEHQAFFKVEANQFCRIPDGVSDEEATWSSLGVTTQLAVRRAQHALGENVAVVGLGILGQLVVQYLVLAGARRIVAIDPAADRLEMARAHGATDTLALGVGDARPVIQELTHGALLDVVYDVTGHPAVLAVCVPLLHKLGRLILLGDTPTPAEQRLGPSVVGNSIAILGIHGTMWADFPSPYNPWTRPAMIELFFDYLLQGRMRVADLVTHRMSPHDAPGLYARLLADRSFATGIVFDWSRV